MRESKAQEEIGPSGGVRVAWHQVVAMYFRKLTPEEVELWEADLFDGDDKIKYLSEEELIKGVRSCAELKDKSAWLDMLQLRKAIFRNRRLSNDKSKAVVGVECKTCGNSGWVHVPYFMSNTGRVFGVTTDKTKHNYSMATPCLCAYGERCLAMAFKSEVEQAKVREISMSALEYLKSGRQIEEPEHRVQSGLRFDDIADAIK